MSRAPIQIDSGSFVYDGDRYILDVRFVYRVKNGDEGGVSLSFSHIIDLEMDVSIDKLYSEGFVIYNDVDGQVGKMIGVFDIICQVTFVQYMSQGGGTDTEKMDPQNKISHSFLVDNIEIVENDESSITYCIHLRGSEYKTLVNRAEYSNYGQDGNDIIGIVKDILSDCGKKSVDDTFTNVVSGVKINYITSGNDTVQSAIEYLMQKQFFYQDTTDQRMKFLVYNFIDDNYGVFQFGQTPTPSGSILFISMNNTEFDEIISKDMVRLASISDVSKTEMLRPISQIMSRSYSFEDNVFEMRKHDSQKIVNFFGGDQNSSKIPGISPDGTLNYEREVSEWSNDVNVYRDFLNIFMKWDSVRVNAGGAIGRKLMSVVNLGIDAREEMSLGDSKQDVNDNLERYRQL